MSKEQKGKKAPEKEKEKAGATAPAQGKVTPAAAATAPTAAPATAPAEAVPEKVKKERKKAKPKANVQVWKLYKVNDNSLDRLRKECPRCGKGFFMAEHKERQSCGHCGYTAFRNRS